MKTIIWKFFILLFLISNFISCFNMNRKVNSKKKVNQNHLTNLSLKEKNKTNSIKNLELHIQMDKNEFVQGERPTVFLYQKNSSKDTITYKASQISMMLYHYEKDKTISTYRKFSNHAEFQINPNSEIVSPFMPLQYFYYNDSEISYMFQQPHLFAGTYDFYFSIEGNDKIIVSNKVTFVVKSVPEELKIEFKKLHLRLKPNYTLKDFEDFIIKFDKSFYKEEFYMRLAYTPSYFIAFCEYDNNKVSVNKAFDFYSSFILNFPNNGFALKIFGKMYSYREKFPNKFRNLWNKIKNIKSENSGKYKNRLLEAIYVNQKVRFQNIILIESDILK